MQRNSSSLNSGTRIASWFVLFLIASLTVHPVLAEPIQWVTVGDPGNTADMYPSLGAVATSFQIMKNEFTNQQYADFLNAVATSTDTYSLYSSGMGLYPYGGITRTGVSGSYSYSAKINMGDKPVTNVTWFDSARVANWLMNGATSSSSTETGAYTLNGAMGGSAPMVNSDAMFYIPTQNQWYKAAYYKGGSTNAGYWDYATQSDTIPTPVTAGSTGIGSAGNTGNFANYDNAATWGPNTTSTVAPILMTTVGTNGGPSAYGTFDMSGNVSEWNDLTGITGLSRGFRGGNWFYTGPSELSSSYFEGGSLSVNNAYLGFRLASPVAVPEPSTIVMALAGLACGCWRMWRRVRA